MKSTKPILLFLTLIWSFINFTEGQGVESERDRNKEYVSNIKLHTCCALDLNLPEAECKSLSKEKPKSNSWTFPQHLIAENISTKFLLEQHKISCKSDSLWNVYLPLTPREGSQKLLKNGYLKIHTDHYPPAEYCINAKNETDLEIKVCPQECSGSRPCIKKCCSLDKIYSFGIGGGGATKGCQVPKGDYFKPIFYDDYSTKSTHDILDPHYIETYPSTFKYQCPGNRTTLYLFPENTEILNQNMPVKFNSLVYRIREDGKIMFKYPKDGKCGVIDPESVNLCVDGVMNYGRPNHSYEANERELVMFLCTLPNENVGTKKFVGILYGVVMMVSSIFLLLTILTYAALWERQSVHGWTIVSNTGSLFCMYIFIGAAHIIGVTNGHELLGSPQCIGIGIIAHYFFLATMVWLLMISVDLWLTFRAFTPRSGTRSKGLKRYIMYSICGWGVPLIFVVIGIILDSKYPENECHDRITPAYGKDSCFPQQKALGVYLYYPISAMIALNVVFFTITTSKLYMYRQSTKMATKDDKQAQFYRLFLKLFFVMGVLWIFEVISWATSGNGYYWYWVVFDLLNVLRALAVFIIFVCKRDIIIALEEKYPCLKPVLLPFAWLVRTRHSPRSRDSESTGHNSSMMTRTSTMRQTISSDGKPESIGLIHQSNK